MPCLMLIEAQIDDPAAFRRYAMAVPPLVARFGGRYRVLGATPQVLEGDWPAAQKAVVSEWPSREAALAFWHSPEYAEAKALRDGTGRFRVVLLDTVAGETA